MFNKKTKKKKEGNTFYRDSLNRDATSTTLDYKKIGSGVFKYGKWAIYGFLGVTAIWGCVDGFLITTETTVSRGMEVYMTYDGGVSTDRDGVYSNIYASQTETGFRAPNLDYTFTGDNQYESLAVLPLYIQNPYVQSMFPGISVEVDKDGEPVNATPEDSLIYLNPVIDNRTTTQYVDFNKNGGNVAAEEWDSTIKSTQEQYGINFHEEDVTYSDILINQQELDSWLWGITTTTDGSPLTSTSPDWFNSFVINKPTYYKQVSNTDAYAFARLSSLEQDATQSVNYTYMSGISSRFLDTATTTTGIDEVYNFTNIVDGWGFTDPTIGSPDLEKLNSFNLDTYDQTDVDYLKTLGVTVAVGDFKDRNEAAKYMTNIYAFFNGGTSNSDNINLDKSDGTEISLSQWVNDDPSKKVTGYTYLPSGIDISVTPYEASYAFTQSSPVDPIVIEPYSVATLNRDTSPPVYVSGQENIISTSSPASVVGGSSVFVTASTIKKGFQVVPSQETLDAGKAARSNNWTTQHGGSGADGKVANAGWVLMDQSGEAMKLYDNNQSSSDSWNYSPNSSTTNYMSAQQLRYSYGAVDAPTTTISNDNVLDAKSDTYVNGGYKINSDYGVYNAGTDYTLRMNFYDDYQGFSNMTELGFSTSQTNYVQPDYQTSTNNESYNDIVSTDSKLSSLSSSGKSIQASGQDQDNSKRIALVSWGQAWSLGPFYGMFVWPLSKVALWIQSWLPVQMGIWGVVLGIFLVIFFLRSFSTILGWKQHQSQVKMQEVQLQVTKINAKYDKYKGNKAMKRRKQMEVMALYRKAGVNPLGSIGQIFTTMPTFLAIWTIINALIVYKTATVGTLSLGISSLSGMFSFAGGGVYFAIAAAVITMQIISMKLPTWLSMKKQGVKQVDDQTKQQMKKSGRTQTIMMVVFIIMGITVPSLLAIYWTFSSLYTILLTLLQNDLARRRVAKNYT